MTIEELNEIVDSGEMDEFIRVCEARQVKRLSHLADRILEDRARRLILVAGGSSAGKTTTAKRLATQLRVEGVKAFHFSTDDYFVGDRRNPRKSDGSFDYESVDCVDSARLSQDLAALIAGGEIHPRRFDFIAHEGYDSPSTLRLPPHSCIVLEGIHALNPALTREIDDGAKFRVFADPITQIEIFGSAPIPPTSARLLRRIVRDNSFRKMKPETTFEMWPDVIAGEKKWILPFKPLADAIFDTGLEYELAVLKPYIAGLVEMVLFRNPKNDIAEMVSQLLRGVHAASSVAVPGDSILRETIGGSQLEY